MKWDALPDVRSPVGRRLGELLETGPRRQELPGYEPVYRDFVDYILRCTHRIWEQKNPGLCRSHYAPDCVIHTLAGPATGAETVVQNTINTLAATSDRQLIGEDVIWSNDGDAGLYSSHRIVSCSTHMGDDPLLGAATLADSGVMTIADCLCRENRIVEEWLVRDNLRAVRQVGLDPWTVAQAQADADRTGDQERHGWYRALWNDARTGDDAAVPADHPAAHATRALALALRDDLHGEAAAAFSAAVETRWPSGRHGFGRGFQAGCIAQLRAMIGDARWRLDHVAARPLPGADMAVALRWRLAGRHLGHGAWGPPTGREVVVMAVSHYRIRGGLIVEDATVFDELAILRRLAGGFGA